MSGKRWLSVYIMDWSGTKMYLENSIRASVARCEKSFLTSKMFLGGDGHRRARRSFSLVSASVSGEELVGR